MQKTLTLSAALAALALVGVGAMAQTPPPPAHHSIFSKLFHPKPKPGQSVTGSFGQTSHMMPGHMMPGHMMPGHSGMMGGSSMMHGGIIANKNSHVYHMPGDRGALPASQNRIYFPTAAAAEAAGYHRAGGAHTTMSRPMMHSSPMHGMPMHGRPMPGGMTH